MLEFSTEGSPFQVFFIIFLVLLSDGNYIFNQIQPLTPLVDKLYACTRLPRKPGLYGDAWKPYHSTLVHQKDIGKTAQVLSLFLNLKWLLLQLNTLELLSDLYKNNLIMASLFQSMRTLVSCRKICAPNHALVQLSVVVLNL